MKHFYRTKDIILVTNSWKGLPEITQGCIFFFKSFPPPHQKSYFFHTFSTLFLRLKHITAQNSKKKRDIFWKFDP